MKKRTRTSEQEARLMGLDELVAYTGLGRNKARDLAEEANAVKRFGRRCLYDRILIDRFIDNMTV